MRERCILDNLVEHGDQSSVEQIFCTAPVAVGGIYKLKDAICRLYSHFILQLPSAGSLALREIACTMRLNSA